MRLSPSLEGKTTKLCTVVCILTSLLSRSWRWRPWAQNDPGRQGSLQSLPRTFLKKHEVETFTRSYLLAPLCPQGLGATLSFPHTVTVSAFRAAGQGLCAGFCDCALPPPQAIESFALMVKQTAQMLQAFGTELAETELPNDVQSTSLVLSAHTEKKAKVKVSAVCGAAVQSQAI